MPMSQASIGLNDSRGTTPVWKRALTAPLQALSGLMHGHYQSTYHRSGAAPSAPPRGSLWSSLTSGIASAGHFLADGAVHAVSAIAGAVWSGIQLVGKSIVNAAKAVWDAVFRAIDRAIAEFSAHETAVDQQLALQDKQAEKQYERIHEQKVYDAHLLALKVAQAKQAVKPADKAKTSSST